MMAVWAKALRLPFLTATLVPVLLGSVLSWYVLSTFHWDLFFLVLVGVSCLQLATNLSNDYFDHTSGNDAANKNINPFTGGSRVIQDGLLKPEQVLAAAISFLIAGLVIGGYLAWYLEDTFVLLLGAIGAFIAYFYTASPLRLGYRGFGEVLTGIAFGPLVVVGAFYVQSQVLVPLVYFASLPIAVLVMLILIAAEFPDYEADRKVSKKTMIVLFGKRESATILVWLLALSYLLIPVGIWLGHFPWMALCVLVTLPLAVKAANAAKTHYDNVKKFLVAIDSIIKLHLAFGLLFVASFAIDKFFF